MRRIASELRERLVSLFRGEREDAELREEMAFHLEMQEAANLAAGMTPREAKRAARHKLGGTERFMEEARDERGVRGVLDFGRDLRIGWRGLRRSPVFAVVAIGALSLGIGATTAVFGLLNRLLLSPLPGVANADELVLVHMQEDEFNWTGMSWLTFNDMRDAATAFSGFAGYAAVSLQVSPAGGRAEIIHGASVVGDYFGTLGVVPAQGRFFTETELTAAGDPLVVVLAEDAAERLYPGGDAVGRSLRANGHTFTVVGIAPGPFAGLERTRLQEAWVPPGAYPLLRHMDIALTNRRAGLFREFVGRVRENATPELAQQQMRARMAALVDEHPGEMEVYREHLPTVFATLGMSPFEREVVQRMLTMLFGVSLLVLLIASANVANLLVFRGVVRRGEAAVRRALGGSNARLLQQNFAEGLIIAVIGAACGTAVAYALTMFLGTHPALGGGMVETLAVDGRVLAFTMGIAFSVAIAFATVPTLMTRGLDLVGTLRQTSRGETGRHAWARGTLIIVQLGASVALLVVSLLLTRTVSVLSDVELGFDPQRVFAFGISEEEQGYNRARLVALQAGLLERAMTIRGVEAAAISPSPPFATHTRGAARAPGWPETRRLEVDAAWGTPALFRTLDVPVVEGRTFTEAESADTAARVVVLNRTAAEQLFGTVDVVGRTMLGGWSPGERTVVGVVENVRHGNLREPITPVVYYPNATYPLSGFFLLVRSQVPPGTLEPQLRDILAGLDPDLPFFRAEPIDLAVKRSMAREAFLGRVTALLAVIAGLLAASGLYGMLSYSVAQRTREIGIRVALGAGPAAVVRWVTGRALVLCGAGLAIGLAGGVVIGRTIRSQLYGVSPLDPASYIGASVILLAVALVASALPARTAVAVQPAGALRSD